MIDFCLTVLDQKNEDLWSHMSSLLSRTIETSSKNLIETDKLLVKCQASLFELYSAAGAQLSNVIVSSKQVTLQSVSTATKKVNKEMNSLTCNIKDLFSANFLPTVSSPTH